MAAVDINDMLFNEAGAESAGNFTDATDGTNVTESHITLSGAGGGRMRGLTAPNVGNDSFARGNGFANT